MDASTSEKYMTNLILQTQGFRAQNTPETNCAAACHKNTHFLDLTCHVSVAAGQRQYAGRGGEQGEPHGSFPGPARSR